MPGVVLGLSSAAVGGMGVKLSLDNIEQCTRIIDSASYQLCVAASAERDLNHKDMQLMDVLNKEGMLASEKTSDDNCVWHWSHLDVLFCHPTGACVWTSREECLFDERVSTGARGWTSWEESLFDEGVSTGARVWTSREERGISLERFLWSACRDVAGGFIFFR